MIKRKKTNILVRDITFPLTPYQIKSKKKNNQGYPRPQL